MANIYDLRWHPLAEKWPLVEGAEYEDLKASIADQGRNIVAILYRVLQPGTPNEEKEYLDGRNRMRACLELGLTPNEERVVVPDDRVARFVLACNDFRRHEDVEKRRARVLEFSKAGMSTRTIAAKMGVGQATVVRDQQANRRKQKAKVEAAPVEKIEAVPVPAAAPGLPGQPGLEEQPAETGPSPVLPDILGRNGRTYKRDKVEGRADKKPAPVAAGKELVRWKDWDSVFGQLLRGLKEIEKACKESAECKRDFADLKKKYTAMDQAVRDAFDAHNGKGAKAPKLLQRKK